MRVPHCPHCPYSPVKPARFSWFNWPLLLTLHRPYRCRSCFVKFWGRFYPFERVAIWRWLM